MPDVPDDSSSLIVVQTPAKVNLHLGVGDARPDGFHELVTVFHAVDLYDTVRAYGHPGIAVDLTGEHVAGVPVDERNLAWRAANLLAALAGIAPHVHLALAKQIPVAGGMAGGSADAAGALLACARLWGVEADLPMLAAELGSDVPFALLGGTALGTGRGEVLEPLPTAIALHWVFAFSDTGISTVEAYRELDRLRASGASPAPIGRPDALITALGLGDLAAVAAHLGNDLQAAAISLQPTLSRTLDAGISSGALAGIVSGSGPTCAFLCAEGTAETVQEALRRTGHRTARATGPAHGATII